MFPAVLCFALVAKLHAGGSLASELAPCPAHPWVFNVFALKDIGSQAQPYHSDFEGSAAAVGDVHYSRFSLNVNSNGTEPYPVTTAQYAGGHLHMDGGRIAFSGIEVHGSVHLRNGASIEGNALVGGNVSGSGPSPGDIQGNLYVEGEYNSAVGALTVTTQPFQPTLNLQDFASYFTNLSNSLSSLPSTVPYSVEYGQLTIDASLASGTSAVLVPASVFLAIWSIQINGTENTGVVINVNASNVLLRSLVWSFNGIHSSRVVLNLFNAHTLDIEGGPHQTTILAPAAVTTFNQGLVAGNLVVQSLHGGGQVNFPAKPNAIRCVPAQPQTTQQSTTQQTAQQAVPQQAVPESIPAKAATAQATQQAVPQQAAPQAMPSKAATAQSTQQAVPQQAAPEAMPAKAATAQATQQAVPQQAAPQAMPSKAATAQATQQAVPQQAAQQAVPQQASS